MTKKMLIDAAHPEEVRVALLDQGKVEDFDFESATRKPLRGNIFLARVTRVEPSLQAAFVEYGGNRHGFLAFSEIHPDYYQIPVSDREQLQAAEAEVAELAAQLELAQRGDEEDDEERLSGVHDDERDAAGDDEEETSSRREVAAESEEDALEDADADSNDAPEEEEEEEDVKKPEQESEANAEEPDDDKKDVEAASDDKQDENYDPSAIAEGDQPTVHLEEDALEAKADPATENEAGEEQTVEASEADPSDDDAGEKKKPKAKRSRKAKADPREALFERYKEAKRKRSRLLRNYKIQEVIKRRQILLVQVVKEERGTKGAALTTYMSLAGRYCVLMPNTARGGGISRKIATASDRKRLRRVVDSLEVPQGMGLIIRTAGAKRTKTEIKRDYDYLLRLWENIRTLTLKSIAPCLIYEEASLIKRAIRDLYDKDISKVLVEGEAGYREAKDFMKMLMPSHAKNVQPYKERAPIFLKHNVENQLDGMYQPTVRLKSGGYIVIHQTEALVAIDVNSGRATRERNIELTALKTNIEAAQEAARQFRLRDLAGLIVLDFIDMEEPKNNRKVEKALKEALKSDRARIQVGRISNFGLLELSRQRRRSGIVDGTTHVCPTCAGAGAVRSHEIAALRILRAIEGEAISGKVGRIVARTSLDVSLHILNHNREWLERIEHANGVKVEIVADSDKAGDAFDLEKSGTPVERSNESAFVRPDQTEPVEVAATEDDEDNTTSSDDDEQRDGGRKRRRRRRRRKDASEASDRNDADRQDQDEDEAKPAKADSEESEEDGPKKKRRRGRRGGRRNRRNANQETQSEQNETSASENDEASTHKSSSDAGQQETAPEPVKADNSGDGAETKADAQEPAEPEIAAPKKNGAGKKATAKAEEPAPEPQAAEPNVATEETPSSPAEPKKSGRKGWWQRAIG